MHSLFSLSDLSNNVLRKIKNWFCDFVMMRIWLYCFCSLILIFLLVSLVADEETGWYDGQVKICLSVSILVKLC